MWLLTSEHVDLISYLHENDDSQNGTEESTLNQTLNDNHEEVANR